MIQVENLTKKFGQFTAVDNISFRVGTGEVLGFLGPNGAGKSTTMRIITGYLQPASGMVKVNNIDVAINPEIVKSCIGYLPETTPVYKDMTVHGFLKFAASIRKVQDVKESIDRVVELCHLDKVFRKPIDTLSKGYTQRVCLAQALIHDPPCLILDEPTDGLDPIQKKEIQELIKVMGKTKTILISTHMLDEVEDYCTRIVIISEGKIKIKGTLNEVKRISKDCDTLLLEIPERFSNIVDEFIRNNIKHELNDISRILLSTGIRYRLYPVNPEMRLQAVQKIFHFLKENKIQFTDFKYDRGSLTEAFRNIAVSSKVQK